MFHLRDQPWPCRAALSWASFDWHSHLLGVLLGFNDPEMPSAFPGDQRNDHSSTTANGEARTRRNSRKGPVPWFVLKLSVGLTVAIIAYTSYVYIGRLCIPMIRRENSSLGSRTLGSE